MRNQQHLRLHDAASIHKYRNILLPAFISVMLVAFVLPTLAADNPIQKQSSPPTTVSKKANLYDIDATGTDIKFVIEALAQCSGINIIVSPEVSGPVTAHLKQMSVDAILDCLSTVQGFRWENSGGTYMLLGKAAAVQTEAPIPPDEQLLVWQCRHVKAADAAITLKGIFPNLKVIEGPNSATPVLPAQSGGVSATAGGGAGSSGSSSGSQSSGGLTATVLIYGPPNDVEQARNALTQIDKARAQVSIKVAVTELNSNASKELGIDWTYSDVSLSETAPKSLIKIGQITRESLSFTGVISALMKNGGGKLLAEPNISVIDGESASILIGDRILFPKLIGYNQNGSPLFDKAEENVGIYLQIAAKVGNNDEITLTLFPQVSLVTGYLKTQAGEYPQISTREARTTVMVKDGSTLSIAGLIRDDDIRTSSKVPLLGDLPIIGQIFKRDKKTRERSEIVILLTPKITSMD